MYDKSHGIFEKNRNDTNIKLKILKSLSTTRYAFRAEAMSSNRVKTMTIIKTILEINQTITFPSIKTKEKGIISQCQHFSFILSLELTDHILQLVLKVSKILQNPAVGLIVSVNQIEIFV